MPGLGQGELKLWYAFGVLIDNSKPLIYYSSAPIELLPQNRWLGKLKLLDYNVISISLRIPIVHRNELNNQVCLYFCKKNFGLFIALINVRQVDFFPLLL